MSNFLEMSPDLAAVIPGRMLNVHFNRAADQSGAWAYGSPNLTGILNGGSNGNLGPYAEVSYLHLMQGTVPTDLTTLTSVSSRSTDILATFTTMDGTTNPEGDFLPTQTTINPAVIETHFKSALASGTVTWFWLVTASCTNDAYGIQLDPIIHQIVGTVGATGSGMDLELPDTNIITGQQYRIVNFKIQFPTSWTF